MDFLSIRKKARERAEAKDAARPVPAAAPPRPPPEAAVSGEEPFVERRHVRRPDPVLTEAELHEGTLQERFQGLAQSTDGRFATWRPGSGPPPVEPDHGSYATPQQAEPGWEPDVERAREPVTERAVAGPASPTPEPPAAPPSRAAVGIDPLDVFFYRPDEEAAIVPTVGGGAGDEPAHQPPEILDEYLTFLLGQEEYAVAIERVREVLRAPAITEVPRAPVHVKGVVTVRGEVVAVVDARGRLGLGGEGFATGRIVIVDAGEGPIGLLVDAVASVVRLPRGSIEPCPQGMSAGAAECVTGIGRHRDRLFMVIDPATLLPRSAKP